MFTNKELTFYRWLASDSDLPVIIGCCILAFVAGFVVFGGWAVGCMIAGFGMGVGCGLLWNDYQEFKRDWQFRYEFDTWEGSTWTHDYYNR